MTTTTPTPDPRSPRMIVDQPTPCYIPPGTKLLDPTAFDILIEHDRGQSPIWRHAVREATAMCNSCPVRAACHTENADEEWVQAITSGRRALAEPITRATCGSPNGSSAHYKRGETACEACRKSEWQKKKAARALRDVAATVTALEEIPDEVRAMHAAFQRYKSKGEPIPGDVRSGERTYQTLKKRIARAAKKDAA